MEETTETIGLTLGNYYRDLARNYDDYSKGVAPWPERPEGWYDPLQGQGLDDYCPIL
jgi:hypothetical protein